MCSFCSSNLGSAAGRALSLWCVFASSSLALLFVAMVEALQVRDERLLVSSLMRSCCREVVRSWLWRRRSHRGRFPSSPVSFVAMVDAADLFLFFSSAAGPRLSSLVVSLSLFGFRRVPSWLWLKLLGGSSSAVVHSFFSSL